MSIPLMLATLTDRRDFGEDWLLERKLDGERCVARKDRADVRLQSRSGKDLTVGVVQIHPDAESMEFHMKVVRERAERAYAQTLDATTSIEVYGTPSDTVLEMLREQAGSGVSLNVRRYHLGGFTRVQAG